MDGYSLSDIKSVMDAGEGFGGSTLLILLFLIIFLGGGNLFGKNSDFTQYAQASQANEILLGQKFDNLSRQVNQVGDGLASSTFSLNNQINTVQSNLGAMITNEGRTLQNGMCELKTAIHAEGEATRSMIQQNKIETLQAEVNELKMAQSMCGVPKINPYLYNIQPTCNCNAI